jgi:hypothetical protein
VEDCSWEELSRVFTDIVSGHNRFGDLTLRRQAEAPGQYNAVAHEFDFKPHFPLLELNVDVV